MNRLLLGIMAGLLLLAGCTGEENLYEQPGSDGGLKSFTSFTATLDDVAGTRTYFSDTPTSDGLRQVCWNQNDEIFVYSDTNTELKTFKITSLSEDNVATFSGEEVTGNEFYAIYARRIDCSIDDENPNIVHLNYANYSSTYGFRGPMVAISSGNTLSFRQTTGIIHINVGNVNQLDKVYFSGNNGEVFGGSGYIDFSQNQPTLKLDDNAGISGMTQLFDLAEFDGQYTDIYYVLPPMVFENGFAVRISGVDSDGNEFIISKDYNSRFEVKVGTISNFSLVDISAELQADKVIEFEDPIAKQICVENWDTNGDGELSYAEAAAVTDIGVLFRNNSESGDPTASRITKDMKSFNEFQYFTGVTELKEAAFLDCARMESIILPKSLTAIGNRAFIMCRSLTELEIPDGVISTGGRAFSSTSLKRLHIPASLVSFGSIDNCNTLNEITVDVKNPVYDSRENCNAIIETATNTLLFGCNNTQIPSSVTKIASSALFNYSGFTNDNLDLGNVTSVGARAFFGTNLSGTLRIPASLIDIGNEAFSGAFTSIVVDAGNSVYDSRDNCNAIIETATNKLIVGCSATQIPNTVTALGDGAFYNVQGLGNIVIPTSVTSLGSSVFSGSDIKSVVIPEGVTIIPSSCFSNCGELETVKLPATIKQIGSQAFMRNYKLKKINFPEGLTTIEGWVFLSYKALETIDLPSTLTSIGMNAFAWGEAVTTTIIVRAIEPPTLTGVPLPIGPTYYVPAGSIEAYQAANGWSQIGNFLPIAE